MRANEVLEKHIGKLVFPPESAERLAALGPFESTEVEVSFFQLSSITQ